MHNTFLKHILFQLLLWEATQEAQYKTSVEAFVKSYMPGGSVPYTPCGLAWRDQWGANRYAGKQYLSFNTFCYSLFTSDLFSF